MIYSKPQMVLLAERAATEAGLAPELLCALVDVSSAWQPGKVEVAHASLVYFQGCDVEECSARNYRWGLTQVLGSAAREAGYKESLYDLTEPPANLAIGARVLAGLVRMASGQLERALLLWIGIVGSNFPLRVLAKVPQYSAFLNAAERPAPLEIGRED
jgi:soluble lytic murein transglycosylase-like protein